MQTHQMRFSSLIEQIKQCQQQLVRHIGKAEPEDADNLEQDARNIAKGAFPNGNWPEDLHPWPFMHIQTARLLMVCGRPKDALVHGVKGYMSIEPRTGDFWVRHLFDFVEVLSANAEQFQSNISREDSAFLTEAQFQDVLLGFSYEANLATNKVFGPHLKYSQAVQVTYSNHTKSAGTPLPGTSAFAQRFRSAQSKLLLWAGVNENKGITLSQ